MCRQAVAVHQSIVRAHQILYKPLPGTPDQPAVPARNAGLLRILLAEVNLGPNARARVRPSEDHLLVAWHGNAATRSGDQKEGIGGPVLSLCRFRLLIPI